MKKLYYDAFRSGLIPVKSPHPVGEGRHYIVTVSRTTGAYKKGEELMVPGRDLVNKTRVRNGYQLVATADL